MKNANLTKNEIVDAIVDAQRRVWPVPLPGLSLVVAELAKKLEMTAIKLAREIAAREKERFCCGKCEEEGCHRE